MGTKMNTGDFGQVTYNDFTTAGSTNMMYSGSGPFNWGGDRTTAIWKPSIVATDLIRDRRLTDELSTKGLKDKGIKKGGAKMNKKRGLYQVILVDPRAGKIIFNGFVICDKPEDVLLEADAGSKIKEASLTVSEVDKIVNYLGEIRRVKKSKEGILEIVSEEETSESN